MPNFPHHEAVPISVEPVFPQSVIPQSDLTGQEALLSQRVDELEIRLSYLDDLVDTLNAVIAQQDRQLQDLQHQLRLLYQRLEAAAGAESGIAPFDPASDIPPHY